MNILNKLKALLPVTRGFHQAEINRIYETQRKALLEREIEFRRKEDELTRNVQDVTSKLSNIVWHERGYGEYAVQMNISAELLRRCGEPQEREMIANMLGKQLAHEVQRSKFMM